jgi:membrane protein
MIVKGYRVGPLLKKIGHDILSDNVLGLAAQTAYYFFFSLFPLFLFLAPLLSVLSNRRQTFDWIMTQLAGAVAPDALAVVQGVVKDVVFSNNAPGLISTGVALAAWAGSNVFNSLITALNAAYEVRETRPWWKTKLLALASVAATGLFMILASAIMLGGSRIADWLGRHTALGTTARITWLVLQYPVALALLVATLWSIYAFLPNLRQSRSQVLVGACTGALLWVLATLLFRAYVTHFGSYNKTYGTVGGVIVLLTWMYYTMVVILIGGELNSELHHGTGKLDPREGAVYAGRIVTAIEPGVTSDHRIERVTPVTPLRRTRRL